jgi:hypothetical protein
MKTIYLFGYNIVSAVTAILLRNFFGFNADVRIIKFSDNKENIPSTLESKLIRHILDLNDIDVKDFLKETGGVPIVGSIHKNFKKSNSISFSTHNEENQDIIKYKKALELKIKPEELIDYTSKLSNHLKDNLIHKEITDDYSFTFDTEKATKFLIEKVFVEKLKGRLLFWDIANIVYNPDGYVSYLQSDLMDQLPFRAGLYINCSDKVDLPKIRKELPYNNCMLTTKFKYTDKEKQINNHKFYTAKENGYIFERCLWDHMEITYFFDKKFMRDWDSQYIIGDHILKAYNIEIFDFERKDIYSYEVEDTFNKDIISLRYQDNYVEPLIENRIDSIIKHVFKIADIFEDTKIFSKIYKNYFNSKCKQINENALNNYLSFLSKTEHNYNSYWNKIFESDVDVDLKLDNCLKDVLKFKTFDPDFYKNLWKKELEHLDNFSKKDIEDSESTYKYLERINNDK